MSQPELTRDYLIQRLSYMSLPDQAGRHEPGHEITRAAARLLAADQGDLSLHQLRAADQSRAARWHGSDPAFGWTVLEWAAATGGEAGEMLDEAIRGFLAAAHAAAAVGRASNLAKKIRRHEQGLAPLKGEAVVELDAMLAEECADVLIYLDLLCAMRGIDLAEATRKKFNQVSEKMNFPERL